MSALLPPEYLERSEQRGERTYGLMQGRMLDQRNTSDERQVRIEVRLSVEDND